MHTSSDREPEAQDVRDPTDSVRAQQPVAAPQEVRRVYKGTGLVWAIFTALVGAILLLILIAQNAATNVALHFLWLTTEGSLVIVVLAAAIATICVVEGIGLVWRRRRRQRLTQRDELHRIHAASS